MVGKRQLLLSGLVGLWALALIFGLQALQAYGTSEGQRGGFSLRFPQDSQIKLAGTGKPSLLLFLHPECPCSRATLEELDRVLAATPNKPEVYAVFVVPKGWSTPRAKTALWLRASRMNGVTPVLDREGQEAKRFGAATSGQVYAYSPSGSLTFSGGITPLRGHNGDNPGRMLLEKYLREGGEPTSVANWKVFGCALFGAEAGENCRSPEHARDHSSHEHGKQG
ncbi:MAG: RedB protein [Proteobacteria bacterium]|nr:MAG: RedB protein [Pseudomonadota bacterium]